MSAIGQILYMAAATLFVLGIRFLGIPASTRLGNRMVAAGMIIALGTTLAFVPHFDHTLLVAITAVVGGALGAILGRKVRMTAMPQMVALLNGLGGGAAALVASGGWPGSSGASSWLAILTMVLGSLSFGGSIIAFLKLQEWLQVSLKLSLTLRVAGLAVLAGGVLVGVIMGTAAPTGYAMPLLLMGLVAFSGVLLALPIGGADMPVVISLLNGLTGLSAAATGFVLGNELLIIAGTLVGASGTILTQQMSRAMHRSLGSVIWGGGQAAGTAAATEGTVQPITADDLAMLVRYSRKVVIVPGYGLAVARAQMEVKQLTDLLAGYGVEVIFGIHPVAGRMPGHMNVLLAEANVSYDKLWEMDRINPRFRETDVVLVIGANDVTNPAARTASGSPLSGMPILNVDEAQTVVVLKRSMGRGFAGIDNPLYFQNKTRMFFGDAKQSLGNLVRELEGSA